MCFLCSAMRSCPKKVIFQCGYFEHLYIPPGSKFCADSNAINHVQICEKLVKAWHVFRVWHSGHVLKHCFYNTPKRPFFSAIMFAYFYITLESEARGELMEIWLCSAVRSCAGAFGPACDPGLSKKTHLGPDGIVVAWENQNQHGPKQ